MNREAGAVPYVAKPRLRLQCAVLRDGRLVWGIPAGFRHRGTGICPSAVEAIRQHQRVNLLPVTA